MFLVQLLLEKRYQVMFLVLLLSGKVIKLYQIEAQGKHEATMFLDCIYCQKKFVQAHLKTRKYILTKYKAGKGGAFLQILP